MLLPIEGCGQIPLVPLKTAIEPVVSVVSKIKAYAWVAKFNCQNPQEGLTSDESAAIMLYSMESSGETVYGILNSILRSEEPERSNRLIPWHSYLKLFITALSRLPSHQLTVYRGVKLNLSERYPKGKHFVWWAFSSCTKSLNVLESSQFLGQTGTRTLFVIECFTGKCIRNHSYFPTEDEVLLIAARHFEVMSSLQQGSDLWIIHVKEIQPEFPHLVTDDSISSNFEALKNSDAKASEAAIFIVSSKIFLNQRNLSFWQIIFKLNQSFNTDFNLNTINNHNNEIDFQLSPLMTLLHIVYSSNNQ
ncbi:unnamed protein product [Rotaria sp. Silwood1]|nr:unnamed protein product [Rotaria sp. Silwood1]CAF1670818.1 unnamed protein product [Rotaria sp. Silwood1]